MLSNTGYQRRINIRLRLPDRTHLKRRNQEKKTDLQDSQDVQYTLDVKKLHVCVLFFNECDSFYRPQIETLGKGNAEETEK